MHSDLKKMTEDGWREGGNKMEPFLNSLEEPALNVLILDPSDPTGNKQVLAKTIQARKANMFFKKSLEILEKHYEDAFCKRLLFLSLFGEKCSSQTVARVLLHEKNDFLVEDKIIQSSAHGGRLIDLDELTLFVKERVDIDYQINNVNNVHMNKLKSYLEHLAGT